MTGKLITIEGSEGSGKSSVINIVEKKLKDKSIDCLKTKEPGSLNDPVCTELRDFILNPKRDIDRDAEIFLYIADRCQHINRVVRPALNEGKIVLCDRYIDSTYAYQGWGRRRGDEEALKYIDYLNKKSTGGLIPDLTIILDVTPEIGFKRLMTKEFGLKDRIEQEKLDFFQRVNEGFKEIIIKNNDRNIVMIKTDDITLESVADCAWDYIERII